MPGTKYGMHPPETRSTHAGLKVKSASHDALSIPSQTRLEVQICLSRLGFSISHQFSAKMDGYTLVLDSQEINC